MKRLHQGLVLLIAWLICYSCTPMDVHIDVPPGSPPSVEAEVQAERALPPRLAGDAPAAEAENNVRAKTGTLTHTVSLSGYLKERDGALLAFSVMSNNCLRSAAEIRSLQDAICQRLTRTQ